jgi:adenylate cyclase
VATAARKRSRRRLVELAAICLAVAVVGWFAFPQSEVLTGAERTAQDKVIAWSGLHPSSEDFVFVAIDDPSLKLELWPEDIAASPSLQAMAKGWPWPRFVYADAIERLLGAGARLILFDLILDTPKPGDDALKAALDRHPTQIVVGANLSFDSISPDHPEIREPALRMPAPTLIEHPNTDPRVGFVNFFPESDQKIRSALFGFQLGSVKYPSLAAAAARQLDRDADIPKIGHPKLFRFIDPAQLRIVPFYTLFLPGDWKRTLRDGAVFRDKIVVVGPSAAILHDIHLVADDVTLPGPLLHLNALAALLNHNFYERAGALVNALCVLISVIVAWAIAVRFGRRPIAALSILIACAIGFTVSAYVIAHILDYLLPVVQPGSALLVAGVICISWNFAQERRESGRMRSMLDRYVSRNLVREVLDNRDDFLAALGGSRRPMTVFFSDVRGFTSFVESEDEHAVVSQLNEYLGRMVAIIFRHDGTVDKFMGDGIMAVWGNVLSEGPARDAINAVTAALEMLDELADLNRAWTERGLSPFAIGIGLHHGEAVFGNIGSAEKMEPTVIGDTVNLASRVEGLTKKYAVPLCITHPLAELVADTFLLRSVDLVQVVGKSRPVEIFTVLGPRSMEIPDWLKCHEGGIADYRARRFAEAAAQFRECEKSLPNDRLVQIHLTRCEAFLREPPPDDWTGTEVATSK